MSLGNFPISSHPSPCVSMSTPPAPGLPVTTSALSNLAEASPPPAPPMPVQTPIFIIYATPQSLAGQQSQPKSPITTAPQLNGKTILHKAPGGGHFLAEAMQRGGHILTEGGAAATVLQAPPSAAGGQVFPIINSNGLAQQVILSPPPTHNTIQQQQQQKCEIVNGHFPGIVNGQTVVQESPSIININGTTALLQPTNGHQRATFLPTSQAPQALVSRGGTIVPMTHLQQIPAKRQALHKPGIPRIPHAVIAEGKRTPPPLVQVKEEDLRDDPMLSGGISHANCMVPVGTKSSSSSQVSPKMIYLQEGSPSLSPSPSQILVKAPPPPSSQTSLPHISKGEIPFITSTPVPSSNSAVAASARIINANSMPIFRYRTLNTVQPPLQILTTIPPTNSCEAR